MKRTLFLLTVLILLVSVSADPVIEYLAIEPSDLWVGDSPTISVKCSEENKSISHVYSKISGPYMVFPTMNFTKVGDEYILDSSKIELYLDEDSKGLFGVEAFCVNEDGDEISESGSFYISEISMNVNSVKSNPTYIGDTVELNVDVEKDGSPLKSYDVNFQLFLDDQFLEFSPTQPYYDERKGWVLKFDSPEDEGDYDLEVTASYSGKTLTENMDLTVKNPIQFEITNLNDRTEIKSGDNITVRCKLYDKDEKIDLNKDYITLSLSSEELGTSRYSISSKSTYDEILIDPPSLSAGTHNLKLNLDYNHFSIEENKKIFYTIPLSGRILNYDDDPMNAEFVFSSGSLEKTIKTHKNGSYNGYMSPGNYDLKIKFPHSEIEITDLDLDKDEFSDPFIYHYTEDLDVQGIRAAGVFYYYISPDFSQASVEIDYDSKYITDEDSLSVYRCDDWEFDDKRCDDDWDQVDFDFVENGNKVKLDLSGYSAYAIGNEKSIHLSLSLDKESYYLNDIVTLNGIVKDDANNAVGDAEVEFEIEGTSIKTSAKSSSNGIVSTKMSAPEVPGNYTLSVIVEKYPYENFVTDTNLYVVKKKEISIISPETVRVEQGEKSRIEFSVVNIGQADLYDIELSIDGIPKEYYTFENTISSLSMDEEKKIPVIFSVSENATKGTFGGKFIAEYEGESKEEVFGFSILEKTEEEQEEQSNETEPLSTTGKFVLPEISLPSFSFLYMLPVMLGSFIAAFLLKKRKKRELTKDDNEIKKTFSKIKSQLRDEED